MDMFFTYLSKQWHRFPTEVWEEFLTLNLYPSLKQGDIPDDFVIELIRNIYDSEKNSRLNRLKTMLEQTEKEAAEYYAVIQSEDETYLSLKKRVEVVQSRIVSINANSILGDSKSALSYLNSWHNSGKLSEEVVLSQLNKWYEIIKEYSPDLASSFVMLLQQFFTRNNIRYLVRENGNGKMKILFNPAVIAMERVQSVKTDICRDKPLSDRYVDFELNYGELIDECNPTRIRNVLSSSSNLLEAIANQAAGQTRGTLGNLMESPRFSGTFPHKKTKELVKNLYGFFSDYAGTRHGSMNTGVRELEQRDATTFGILSVLFSDFISQANIVQGGTKSNIGFFKSFLARIRGVN